MVQRKDERCKNIRDILERIDQESPVIATKWSVEEVTPAYHETGYYGGWVSEKFVQVSPQFESREEVEAWREKDDTSVGYR